jgi:hypothetical protein
MVEDNEKCTFGKARFSYTSLPACLACGAVFSRIRSKEVTSASCLLANSKRTSAVAPDRSLQ